MKKAISLTMAALMAMSFILTGCGSGGTDAGQSGAGSSADSGSGDKVLKVAVGCNLTGTGAKAGAGFQTATEMALEDIDYKIGDYTIKPIYVDLTDDPEKGALALEQSIVKDGAQVCMQGWFTTIALTSMDVVAKYKVPYLFNYGAGVAIDEKYESDPEYYSYYIAKTFPTTDFIAEEYRDIIDAAFADGSISGDKKIAIYGEDTDWGHSIGSNFEKYFGEAGYDIVYDEYFQAGTTDFYAILSKIKESGAKVVGGTINTPATAAAFLKQAKEVGLDAQIICHSLNENADWQSLCGDAAEGVLDMMAVYVDDRGADFEKAFKEKAGYDASIACEGVAYDCAKMTFAALQACYDEYGVLDTDTVYKFGSEEIATGKWVYDDSITQTCYKWESGKISPVVGEDAFYNCLAQVQNGEMVVVWPENRAKAEAVF